MTSADKHDLGLHRRQPAVARRTRRKAEFDTAAWLQLLIAVPTIMWTSLANAAMHRDAHSRKIGTCAGVTDVLEPETFPAVGSRSVVLTRPIFNKVPRGPKWMGSQHHGSPGVNFGIGAGFCADS